MARKEKTWTPPVWTLGLPNETVKTSKLPEGVKLGRIRGSEGDVSDITATSKTRIKRNPWARYDPTVGRSNTSFISDLEGSNRVAEGVDAVPRGTRDQNSCSR
jgi:hypothetical protein